MIVHFPIALLLTGFLFVTITMFCKKCCKAKATNADCSTSATTPSCIEKMGFWLLLLGTLSSVASVASGFLFTTMTDKALFFAEHHTLAISTMAIAIVTTAIYAFYMFKARTNEPVKWIAYILYIAVVVMISMTGHYGGLLR